MDAVQIDTREVIEKTKEIVKQRYDKNDDGIVSAEELTAGVKEDVEKIKGVIGNGGINWVISALAGFLLTMLFIIGKDWLFEGVEQWDLLYYVFASTMPTLLSFLIMKPVMNKLTGDCKIKDAKIAELATKVEHMDRQMFEESLSAKSTIEMKEGIINYLQEIKKD